MLTHDLVGRVSNTGLTGHIEIAIVEQCAINTWLSIHTTGAAHASDKARIVRNTESVAMHSDRQHSEVAACASISSQPPSRQLLLKPATYTFNIICIYM